MQSLATKMIVDIETRGLKAMRWSSGLDRMMTVGYGHDAMELPDHKVAFAVGKRGAHDRMQALLLRGHPLDEVLEEETF